MGTPHRERGLLFGLTALQFNFVTREKLLEFAAPWMADAKEDLGKLLLDRGAIQPFQYQAIAAVVEAQLKTNGGDAKKTLSAHPEATLLESAGIFGMPVFDPPPIPSGATRYRLGEELGRGGLGRVLEAFDPVLKRNVAIKLLLDGATQELRDRFTREAEVAARLDHPNIVPVHDFGTREESGRRHLFLAMKRIKGRDLGRLLEAIAAGDRHARRTYSRARLLRIFQDLCLGVAFAHDRGVIHRDLKPSNVMIGDYGETLIVDWGLARVLAAPPPEGSTVIAKSPEGGAVGITLDGEIVGTPVYMAPEQAEGQHDAVDTRSDIYSLGAILYEILTLHPPVDGKSLDEILHNVKSGRITPPSQARRKDSQARDVDTRTTIPSVIPAPSTRTFFEPVTRELDVICLKALALRKEDRYQSALELHDEVQLFLEGVKDRQRRSRLAEEALLAALRHMDDYRRLAAEAEAADARALEIARSASGRHDLEGFWTAEDRAEELRREAAQAFAKAEGALSSALLEDPEHSGVRRARADLAWDSYCRAESRGDERETILQRRVVAEFGGEAYAERLKGEGTLAVTTAEFACPCLSAGRHVSPEEFWTESGLHLLSGRAPDGPDEGGVASLEPSKPARMRVHGRSCRRDEAPGAGVWAWRYEAKGRLLVPSTPADAPPGETAPQDALEAAFPEGSPFRPAGPGICLGRTPLRDVRLPAGSWLLLVAAPGRAPLRVPVEIHRERESRLDLTLWRSEDLPPGFVPVAEGVFQRPTSRPGSEQYDWQALPAPAFFMARHPASCAEYARFLNGLEAWQPGLGKQHVPGRTTGKPYWPGPPWSVPKRPARGAAPAPAGTTSFTGTDVEWREDWPAIFVTWFDALAFARWLRIESGALVTVPPEVTWERAARGADRRAFPWGHAWHPEWANCNESFPDGTHPCGVGEFPTDESPFGVRGLGGNVRAWCLEPSDRGRASWRITRGGNWYGGPTLADTRLRHASQPGLAGGVVGIRFVMFPVIPDLPYR